MSIVGQRGHVPLAARCMHSLAVPPQHIDQAATRSGEAASGVFIEDRELKGRKVVCR